MKRERTYHVYILTNKTRRFYTGVSGNLVKRIWEHKQKKIRGFTRRYNIDRLIYVEAFADIRLAIAREKQIKGWLRSKKIALIESMNPGWKDLSKGMYSS